MGKVSIGIVAFFIGAYVQMKFDVCNKTKDLILKGFKDFHKEEPEHIENDD